MDLVSKDLLTSLLKLVGRCDCEYNVKARVAATENAAKSL